MFPVYFLICHVLLTARGQQTNATLELTLLARGSSVLPFILVHISLLSLQQEMDKHGKHDIDTQKAEWMNAVNRHGEQANDSTNE